MPSAPARLQASIVGLFAANGLLIGSWVGSLPALRHRFELSALGIALLLLTVGACALVTMQLTGRWAERHGARRPALLGPALMVPALLAVALAPAYPVAVVAAALFGVGNGMMDVAMNSLGVEVEQRLNRVRMGLFHGSWSLGSFAAALLVVAFGRLSAHVWPPLATGVAAAVLMILSVAQLAPESRIAEHIASGGPREALPAATWLLGAMALCFGFTEGTAFDWSSLHVAAVTGASSPVAALGLAALSSTMVCVRFLGDVIVARTGRKRAVLVSAFVAACGYAATLSSHALGIVLLGWLLVGLGVGLIAPQIYGLAGHLGGPRMLSVVVGFGYTAFLGCPAVVGATAGAVGLQRAMLIPLGAAVVLFGCATVMPRDPQETSARPLA